MLKCARNDDSKSTNKPRNNNNNNNNNAFIMHHLSSVQDPIPRRRTKKPIHTTKKKCRT